MRKISSIVLLCFIFLSMTQKIFAKEITHGDLVISNPIMKATLPGAPVSGGYMTIKNNGSEPDRLIGAKVSFAGKTEIHEMALTDGVMQMRHLENGLEIPAGQEVTLRPGGYHIMFMMMKEPLKQGEIRKVELSFEKAGEFQIEFDVGDIFGKIVKTN